MSMADAREALLAPEVQAIARRAPERVALILPKAGSATRVDIVTYGSLARSLDAYAAGLVRRGLQRGDRVLLLMPLSADLFALALAVFALGATVVFLDGSLSPRRVAHALRIAQPRVVVSTRRALSLWPLARPLWRAERFACDGRSLGVEPLAALPVERGDPGPLPDVADDELALLSFTSGTSGKPKGVPRSHGILRGQHFGLEEEMPSQPGDVHLTFFPATTLHNLASGAATAFPPGDVRRPLSVKPSAALELARACGVTRISAAPAWAMALADFAGASGAHVPRLRSLIVGGAPSSRRLCRAMVTAFPRCEHTIIYGSTEAEPISSIEMREVLESGGPGYLVGRPYSLARVEVVRLAEEAPSLRPGALSEHRVEQGTHGEVVVTGPQVVRSYVNDEAAERRLKVREGEGIVWHRTGDEALRDAEGRLWLGGRTTERVVTSAGVIQPFVVEAPVTALEGVRSAAFVATSPHKPPVLAVELEPGGALEPAREALAAGPGAGAQVVTVDAMPVDARHQSKVDRARLRVLLAKRGL